MKLQIKIELNDGQNITTTAQPPEFAKWEQKTGFTIQQAQEKIGISDLMFLAWNALKREAAGKPVKPYEIWCDTVVDITVGDSDSPKATAEEA
jgi:hypothetical protein